MVGFGGQDNDITLEAIMALCRDGLIRRGLAMINRLHQLQPRSAVIWFEKARILGQLGFVPEAMRVVQRALAEADVQLEGNGSEKEILVALEIARAALVALDRGGEISERVANAARRNEGYGALQHDHALELQGAGRWDLSLSVIEAALARVPANAALDRVLRLDRARTLVQLGRDDEGIEAARALLREEPDNTIARFTLGRGLAHQGKLKEARTELRRVLEIDPDDAHAKDALAKVEHALRR